MSSAIPSSPPRPVVLPVLMSGGSGTRLWPVSTEARPKQFHALAANATMLQETVRRLGAADDLDLLAPVVICNRRHAALVREQLEEAGVSPSLLVLEPFGRNTAAVAAVAAEIAAARHPGASVLMLPADHVMQRPELFRDAVRRAASVRDRIVTFGIRAQSAHTGYGYIQGGAAIESGVSEVATFKEKPDRATAEAYVEDGSYFWNAGIFLFAPEVMLAEIERHRPAILLAVRQALAAAGPDRDGALHLPDAEFAAVPSEPVDKAVMELTRRAAVAPCDPGWADIGSWAEYWRCASPDGDGNVLKGEVVAPDTSGSVVWSDAAPVAVLGMRDVVVVASAEGVVVLPRDRSEDVKVALEHLTARRLSARQGETSA